MKISLITFFAPVAMLASFAAALPAQAEPLVKTMCLDSDQQLLKDSITALVKNSQQRGLLPALAYDGYNVDRLSPQQRLNLKVEEESKKLSSALFAALNKPEAPADAASGIIANNPSKRSSYSLKERCPANRGVPQSSAQCFGDAGDVGSTSPRDPVDMGVNISQVYETDFDSMSVIQNFMKTKLTSAASNEVAICPGSLDQCRTTPQGFSPAIAAKVIQKPIEIGREYYVQDTTTLKKVAGGLMSIQMTNRSALKVTEIKNICGGSVYVVSAFGLSSDKGFDHTSLLTVIANVGSKTIAVADFSAQAADRTAGGGNGWPLSFPANEVDLNETIIHGYNGVAQIIGSRDHLDSYRTSIAGGARVPATQRVGFGQ